MSITETPQVPITLLDAVNMMLDAVGQSPVNSLQPEDLNISAATAVTALGNTARSVQMTGWYFNTMDDYKLTPHPTTGEIILPANFVAVLRDPYRTPSNVAFTKRGNRLFNRRDNTFVWTTPITVRVRLILEYEELPEPFRWYIAAKAGRTWGLPRSPDSITFRFTAETVQDALEAAETYDADEGGADLRTQSPHFANMLRKR